MEITLQTLLEELVPGYVLENYTLPGSVPDYFTWSTQSVCGKAITTLLCQAKPLADNIKDIDPEESNRIWIATMNAAEVIANG